jgi:hypothetical protein
MWMGISVMNLIIHRGAHQIGGMCIEPKEEVVGERGVTAVWCEGSRAGCPRPVGACSEAVRTMARPTSSSHWRQQVAEN